MIHARTSTAIGRLYFTDKAAWFREVEETLDRYSGNIARTAAELNVERRYFYKVIWREGDILWPIIDRIRAAAIERIHARRRMLTGDSHGPRRHPPLPSRRSRRHDG